MSFKTNTHFQNDDSNLYRSAFYSQQNDIILLRLVVRRKLFALDYHEKSSQYLINLSKMKCATGVLILATKFTELSIGDFFIELFVSLGKKSIL